MTIVNLSCNKTKRKIYERASRNLIMHITMMQNENPGKPRGRTIFETEHTPQNKLAYQQLAVYCRALRASFSSSWSSRVIPSSNPMPLSILRASARLWSACV